MRRSNPVERKTLQEQSRQQVANEKNLKVPLYADNVFLDELKKQEEEEQRKKAQEEHREQKQLQAQERREEKSKLLKFGDINGYLLSVCSIMLILGITSIFLGSFIDFIYSILGITFTIYMGRRLNFNINKFDEVWNVILWNITQTLNDFIEYKVNYDIQSGYKGIINKSLIVMMISLLILPSNNIIYGLSLFMLMSGFLMAISFRDFTIVTNTLDKLIICAIIGMFLKTILYFIIHNVYSIDFFNAVLVNLFVVINLLKDIKLFEPED